MRMEKLNAGSEPIKAYVVLKQPAGSPGFSQSAPGHSGAMVPVAEYARDELRSRLERLGFFVRRVTPVSIIVEAPRKNVEGVFRGTLPRDEFSNSSPSGWRWSGNTSIPDELRDRVESVV